MKRLLAVLGLAIFSLGGGVANAASLKPLAAESAWNSEPIFATAPPGDPRLFVVERGITGSGAAIRVIKDGVLRPTPFLSIPNVSLSSERGLLSMAFAPDYAKSGLFYVFWIANGPDSLDRGGRAGDIRIVEFRRSQSNRDLADPASARLVLVQPHSAGNHNGGWMSFGPDGYLYFTIGDNANRANSPLTSNLFGKVSRIDPADPDGTGPATRTIPSGNPFLSIPGARGEIFARGLRNPYRASFAPDGSLVVADVGESTWEEVNVGNLAGRNLGWPACEGSCDPPDAGLTDPFFVYSHRGDLDRRNTGCAIIGGYVIRDPDLSGLSGRYIYGDACRDDLRTLNLAVTGGDPVDPGISIGAGEGLRSFAEDGLGCTYVLTNVNVYRIATGAEAGAGCPHAVEVPDPPVPPVDSTRPSFALSGYARFLRSRMQFSVKCSEQCSVRTTGAIQTRNRGGRNALRFSYDPDMRSAAGNTWVEVVMELKKPVLEKARRAFRKGRSLYALMQITVSDPSSNSRSGNLTLNIRQRARPAHAQTLLAPFSLSTGTRATRPSCPCPASGPAPESI